MIRSMRIGRDSGCPRRPPVRARLVGATLMLAALASSGAAPLMADESALERNSKGSLAARYWVPRARLPAGIEEATPEFCSGHYVLPDFPFPLDSDPADYPITADADQATYTRDGRMTLDGGVTLSQGNRTVDASAGSLNRSSGEAVMTGSVRVVEPDLVLQGQSARVDLDSSATSVASVEFLLPVQEIRGKAGAVARDKDGDLQLTDVQFTRCEPGNRNWHIGVASLELNEEEVFATARHAVVRVGEVPVLYTPYLRFPVKDDRQSGFLFPDMGFSKLDGLDVRVPYYLNLAPDYDATISPRAITDRGAGVEGEFRHLAEWGHTTFSGGYLNEDDIYDGKLSRDDFNALRQQGLVSGDFQPSQRWLYGIGHQAWFGDFTTVVDYRAVSDRDYFRDLGGDIGVASRVELERRAELGYSNGGLQARFWTQRFERLDDGLLDPYERSPQLDLHYVGQLPGPLQWSVAAQVASFDRNNENLTGIDRATGDRVHVEPRVVLPFQWPWGDLTFTGGVRHTEYDLQELDPGFERNPKRNVGLGSVAGGLYFDRTFEAFGRTLMQSVEPRAYYLYQGYENQEDIPRFDVTELTFSYYQLFRDNRFAGIDRIGDANQLSLGLSTSFRDATSGREYLNASVGQILYFEDRRVTLNDVEQSVNEESSSAFLGQIGSSLTSRLRFSSSLIYDPNLNELDEGAVALQYQIDRRRVFNVGYRNRRQDDISQTDVSAYWPISPRFAFIGRWNYDIEQGRAIETFGGLEYNDCCWQIRLVGRRFLNIPTGPNLVTGEDQDVVRPEDGIFLQIVFKGMGGVGNSLESMLVRGIRGYTSENYDNF
jgi:LPS-assembly protein